MRGREDTLPDRRILAHAFARRAGSGMDSIGRVRDTTELKF
jgi:hypothetical protein